MDDEVRRGGHRPVTIPCGTGVKFFAPDPTTRTKTAMAVRNVVGRFLLHVTAGIAGASVALSAAGAGAQSLTGSPASLDRQNRRARLNDFTYLRTAAQVEQFARAGLLVPVDGNRDYTVDDEVSFRVARPEARLFIQRLAGQYHRACGEPLVVTSLTRPLSDQPENASPRSVHPTGMAVDLRRSTRPSCVRWLERTLLQLEERRVLEVTLEHMPPHFHVAVFPEAYARYVAHLTGTTVARVRLRARAMSSYAVRPADTLWDISQLFGTTPAAIRRANHLSSSIIHPGQVLKIPPADGSGL
jgi:LysM domain/Family of unknown function (DUF5715)